MIDLSKAKVIMRVPKNSFKSKLKDVDTITWLYKISPETADFRHGDEIIEIQIICVNFKNDKLNKRDLVIIQKAIPYPILFSVNGKYFFSVEGELFESDKEFLNGDMLMIEQRSSKLTELYEDIAVSFIPIAPKAEESLIELVARNKRLQALEREMATLQRKINAEKQPNKRIELNEKLKRIKLEKEKMR